MLGLITVEAQWEHTLINRMHFVNEVCLYLFLCFLICYEGELIPHHDSSIDLAMVLFVAGVIVYNLTIITYDALRHARLLCLRYGRKAGCCMTYELRNEKVQSSDEELSQS